MEWDADHSKICGGNWQTYCPPGDYLFAVSQSRGWHIRGRQRTLRDCLKEGRALGVSFADYDDDGFTDIFVSNDGMQAYLYHNNGDGTLEERALESGAALSMDCKAVSGWEPSFKITITMAAPTLSLRCCRGDHTD
jgi:hypothetical protein